MTPPIESVAGAAPVALCNRDSKLARARVIVDHLLEVIAREGRVITAAGSNGIRLSRYAEQERFRATLTPDCSLQLVARMNNLFEEARVFGTEWDLLELQIRGRRTLVVHLRGREIELIEFMPGEWERWFGSNAGADTTPFKVPHVPKSLGEMNGWRANKAN